MSTSASRPDEHRRAAAQNHGQGQWSRPVVLVVAGPGDPQLITLAGRDALGAADTIISDPEVIEIARMFGQGCSEVLPTVDGAGQPLSHAARATLVAGCLSEGKIVARLLSGDPIMDGSLRLEADAFAAHGVKYEVAPGVSPVTGIPAFAGFGLTGGRAREVRIVDADDPLVNLSPADDGHSTLVILNGASRLNEIAAMMLASGWSSETPCAVTCDGATVDQRTVVAPLAELASIVGPSQSPNPSMLVAGEVVAARDGSSWFESKPLFGWRVLVPRTKEQAASLSERLSGYGAVPEEVPTISVEPPRTPHQMERAIHGLVSGRYEWVVFTSANAVKAVCEKFEQCGLDARSFAGLRVAAVGEQTAKALKVFGVVADLVPDSDQSSLGLLEVFPEYDEASDPINRVFLPRADIATDTLVAGLAELNWEVDDITAYRTVRAAPPRAEIRERIKTGGYDAVLFTSSSTVRNLIGIAGKPHPSTVIACIGPATAATAEEHGLRVHVRADQPSVVELAAALARYGEGLRLDAQAGGSTVWRPSQRRAAPKRRAN